MLISRTAIVRSRATIPLSARATSSAVIAASVLGGCGLGGGQGSIIGGVLGLLSLNILGNAIILLGMSPYWQKAFLGGVLLAAVLLERTKIQKRRSRKCSSGLGGACV